MKSPLLLLRAPDDWLLAEIEQTLNIAAQQLALAGNVKAAIGALQTADARLARADKLQTAAMRRALNADMEKLKALPWVDLTGMTVKLDVLVQQIDTLPLAAGPGAVVQPPPANIRNVEQGWFGRFTSEAWADFRELVRIRKVGSDEIGLLTPNQAYFLKENLKLRLLGARMALLAREDGSPEAAYSGRGTPARTLRMGDTRPGVTGGDGGSGSALRRLRLPMGNRV